MKRNNRIIWRVVFWAAVVVAVGCLGFAGWYHYSNYTAAQKHKELVAEVTVPQDTDQEAPAERTYTLEEIEAAEFTGEREGAAPVIPADVQLSSTDRQEGEAASEDPEGQTGDPAQQTTGDSQTGDPAQQTTGDPQTGDPAQQTGDSQEGDPAQQTTEDPAQMQESGAEDPEIPAEVLRDVRANAIDFDRLQSYNSELYAWIRIPGTEINYPVAQHAGEDQLYYLHHDLYGSPQFSGCIFSEEPSAKDLSDPVTVLYGHNMKNGSMFQNLHLFRDEDFFEEHPYLYMYTPDRTLIYRIYSVYPYDSRPLSHSFDFEDPKELGEYLESTMNPRSMDARVRREIKVTAADHVLTLSTCIAGDTGSRLLLQAVLSYES